MGHLPYQCYHRTSPTTAFIVALTTKYKYNQDCRNRNSMQKNGYFDHMGDKTVQDLLVRPKPSHSIPAGARVMAGEYNQPSTFNFDKKPPESLGLMILFPMKNTKHKSTKFYKGT